LVDRETAQREALFVFANGAGAVVGEEMAFGAAAPAAAAAGFVIDVALPAFFAVDGVR